MCIHLTFTAFSVLDTTTVSPPGFDTVINSNDLSFPPLFLCRAHLSQKKEGVKAKKEGLGAKKQDTFAPKGCVDMKSHHLFFVT